jgi:chemotaxis protein MotB
MFCLLGFLFSGCVSKSKYVALETELSETQTQLNTNNEQLEDLQARYQKLQRTNTELLNTIEDLKFELRQEKMTVLEKEQEVATLEATRRDIETSLKEEIFQRDIKLQEIEGKLKVTFVDKILFDSGSVLVKERGRGVLLRLAETFRENKEQKIVVEGHTDDVQIGSGLQAKFPTNWELSTARAAAVVRFLQDTAGIEPERLTASGFSYFQPVASNETEEGRKENRRIEIILAPVR